MGQILSLPIVQKDSQKNGDGYLAYGFSCMQGWRTNMEDAHAMILDLNGLAEDSEARDAIDDDGEGKGKGSLKSDDHIAFFGVYDGHGGAKTAELTGIYLHNLVKYTKAYSQGDFSNALKNGFLNCDKFIWDRAKTEPDDSGCAATSAIITPTQIFCGNAGDSRTIMSINGYAKPLSYDHKPLNEGEKTRISRAGGYVEMGRVNGNLALSRGIGDFEFKRSKDLPPEEQVVTCYPDVIQHNLDFESDEFVVLACDGIWDCLTSQTCVECIRYGIYNRKPLELICEELMDLCCAPTSDGPGIGCDNMSITIVALLDYTKNETLDQWYDKIIERIESRIKNPQSTTYGPISLPYDELYKQMFGRNYSIGTAGDEFDDGDMGDGPGSYGGIRGYRAGGEDDEGDEEGSEKRSGSGGGMSMIDFLASGITSENGVIYLDKNAPQSILALCGMSSVKEEDEDEEDRGEAEEEDEEDEEEEKKDDDGDDNDDNEQQNQQQTKVHKKNQIEELEG